MKTVTFHPQAEEEMNIAARWYEGQQAGLGARFLNSIQETINNIRINPKIYTVIQADIRRGLVKVFPYDVVFKENSNSIIIIAVMHTRRKPNYWNERN